MLTELYNFWDEMYWGMVLFIIQRVKTLCYPYQIPTGLLEIYFKERVKIP